MTTPRPTGAAIVEWDPQPVSFTQAGSPLRRVEPITLEIVKKHQRLPASSSSEDDLLNTWIAAARGWFEEYTGRQIINATYEYALDEVPAYNRIQIPRPPLISVESVTIDGVAFTDYSVIKSGIFDGSPLSGVLDPYCERGLIETPSVWPTASGDARAVKIRFTCGYGSTVDEVPDEIKAVLYRLVESFSRNRSEVTSDPMNLLPIGAQTMMQTFKRRALQTLVPRLA